MSKSPEATPDLVQNYDPNLEALLAQGDSQADIDIMLVNGIDPYQQSGVDSYPLTSEYTLYPVDPTEVRRDAQESLVEAETKALQQASAQDENATTSTFFAAEQATKDRDVQQARHEIEAIFGANATRVEARAIADAIEISHLSSVNKNEIASAAAAGSSPVEQLKSQTEDSSTVENYAALKDKVNGRTERTIEHIAKQTREDLKRFGLHGSSIKKLGDEALRTAGGELTKTDVAIAAEDTAIGEQVIRSLTGGKPKMTKELRGKIKELASKGQLKTLQEAVSNKGRSRGTLRRVGKQLRHTMRNKAA